MVDLILTLLLALIASVVAIMQGVQHSVFSLITVYWLVLATKNWLLLRRETDTDAGRRTKERATMYANGRKEAMKKGMEDKEDGVR